MPVDLTPEALDALEKRLRRTLLYEGSGEGSDLPEEAADTIAALRAAPVAMRDRAAQVALEQAALSKKHADQADEVGHDTTADQMRMEAEVAAAIAQAIRSLPLDAPAPVDPSNRDRGKMVKPKPGAPSGGYGGAPVDPVAEAYREGWRFAYRQCEATGSVPNPDHPALRTASEKE